MTEKEEIIDAGKYKKLKKRIEKEKILIKRVKQKERERVLKLIDKVKLPEDKNYRYSNEYIEEWFDIFKQKIKEIK